MAQKVMAPAEKVAKNKKMTRYSLAFMGFTSVWGFANIVNGFAFYGGLKAVLPWILVMALYFIPYALIVGELGATYKKSGGGVSSWVYETTTPVLAFFAGWMYWVVHMPYLSQKPNQILVALSWAIFQEDKVSQFGTFLIQAVCLGIFLLAIFISTKGANIIKKICSIAGICSFVLSMLFILMMWTAPYITKAKTVNISWSLKTFTPEMNFAFFTSLSVLILAVGGCEKIAPYVNKMKKPGKDFPKGMIAIAVMVSICAILGTIALGMMFPAVDASNKNDLITNGAYRAFQILGNYYHVGNLMLIIYAIVQVISFSAALIISIDAPLRVLLDNADTNYLPEKLLKKNKHGTYINGVIMVTIIVGILIIIPAFGIGDNKSMMGWLIKANSVCMPLRYCWIFVAYFFLKKSFSNKESEYKFVKNKYIGMIIAAWCFIITLGSCILGVWSKKENEQVDVFQTTLNIVIPIVLVALGFVMMAIARRKNGTT